MFSTQIEKKLLALFMQSPTHMRVLSTDLSIFAVKQHQNLADLVKSFVHKYRCVPTKEMIIGYANEKLGTSDKAIDQTAEALELLSSLPKVKPNEFQYCWDKAINYMVGRRIFDLGADLTEKFKKNELNFIDLKKDILSQLLQIEGQSSITRRGFIYENVQERYREYKESTRDQSETIIPYGITALDEKVGGMRKSFVSLFFSKTGGGKSRMGINLAYNAAKAGYNVMYFSLEMAFNLLASCFDSRIAAVDSREIIFGKLNKESKHKYKKALKLQVAEKLNIWIVDVALNSSSNVILEEAEIYTATTGKKPDLIVVDYAGIMMPVNTRFFNGSERYKNLFEEYHQYAKYLNSHILTFMQETRERTKGDIEKKKKGGNDVDDEGTQDISWSNAIAPSCETVFRIKQDSQDRLASIIWLIFVKNRYGLIGVKLPITARWATTYVGDRVRADSLVLKNPMKKP